MSEYSELIKNYNKIRDYIRDFYIYGFHSRNDFNYLISKTANSGRTYDNEKRRIENYLGDIMYFRQEQNGKKVFISLDNNCILTNPFYKSFKTKTFTKNDCLLHFSIIFLLTKYQVLSLNQIEELIYKEIIDFFNSNIVIDQGTIRNKINEYIKEGIIKTTKEKNKLLYSLSTNPDLTRFNEAIKFYTECFPLGVIGSFIEDRLNIYNTFFIFKNKYLLDVVDSELIYELLIAINKHENVEITVKSYHNKIKKYIVFPYKIAITVQSGRNYLICIENDCVISKRLDKIMSVKRTNEVNNDYESNKELIDEKLKHTWRVYINNSNHLDYIKLYLYIDNEYTIERIKNEGKNGTLEKLSDNHYIYTYYTYDIDEVRPWLRTFIGEIEKIECSKKDFVSNFIKDIKQMKQSYGDNL